MKHEALVDAISMLDDELIAEAQQPFRKRRALPALRLCAAAAACAAVVGAVLLIPRGGVETGILIMGQDPSQQPVSVRIEDNGDNSGVSVIRAFAMELTDIPVTITATGRTVVSVSAGELRLAADDSASPAESSLELNGSTELLWSVPLWDSIAEFQLTAQTEKSCRILQLSYDESSGEWTAKEIPGVN